MKLSHADQDHFYQIFIRKKLPNELDWLRIFFISAKSETRSLLFCSRLPYRFFFPLFSSSKMCINIYYLKLRPWNNNGELHSIMFMHACMLLTQKFEEYLQMTLQTIFLLLSQHFHVYTDNNNLMFHLNVTHA